MHIYEFNSFLTFSLQILEEIKSNKAYVLFSSHFDQVCEAFWDL